MGTTTEGSNMKRALAVLALLAACAMIAAPPTTWEEGAEAYADHMCKREGGAETFYYDGDEGTGRVDVTVVCSSGLTLEGHFNCPMCEPV